MSKGFYVATLYDVAQTYHESWNECYTLNKSQQSDDNELIWVVGNIPDYSIESFTTSKAMFNWCYKNGWTKPSEETE